MNWKTCAFALFLTPLAGAAVLYGPTPIGSSARNADYATVDQSGWRTFDNFTVTTGGFIEKVTWYGFYLDFSQPGGLTAPAPDTVSWDLAFHSDNAGAPGAQLAIESFAAAGVTSTFQGHAFFSAGPTFAISLYQLAVNLATPFFAAPGVQYWISPLAISNTTNPSFILRGATGGDESSYQERLGAGMSVISGQAEGRDRAIVLEGTPTPEPATWALSAAAGLGLLIARKRRLRRVPVSER